MARKIIIEIQGARDDQGHVRLEDFTDKLESLRKALTYAEQHAAIDGRRRPIHYRLVNLHHSRATLEIEAVSDDPLNDRTGAVIYEFSTRLRQINSGKVPDDVQIEELEAYGHLAPASESHIEAVVIGFDAPSALKPGEPVLMTREFEEKVAELIGPEEIAWGTMTGYLDALNIHERNIFYLWPRFGPKRLHCTFTREIRDDVKKAIGHYVEASGRIHFRRRDNLAHRMTSVQSVDVLDNETPQVLLSELRGIAPDLLSDTSRFVDTYDEDW